jgi:hypothetical protein
MGKRKHQSLQQNKVLLRLKKKKVVIPTETFKADGVEYKFTAAAFRLDGKVVKAVDALKDEKVLAQLVEMKAGVIASVDSEDQEEGGE